VADACEDAIAQDDLIGVDLKSVILSTLLPALMSDRKKSWSRP
jgi:hypothetical protein